ncbi:NADH:flavin oxidoreductase/NADH oxidase family protein [Luminiphilus sp.]|nr:NADH:flavin oxidoreductase/NADH oxidase family protein [Luminiphilus sp.]MDB2433830.1 NADH:flavin oxidoreductase/NADH oxidase family protein [Luminiphilus sp.]MDB2556427.1 NADH:flavin oxidoreductase/NADH oxidase family protein [Luminiphilus sp.]
MLEQPLTLPCGAVVPNRLCKAAMTEGLAHPDGSASEALARLYGVWSDGGSGILLSGNIQVDGDHLERPGNVVVDDELSETAFNALAEMATQGTRAGNHLWAQISHAGRQTQKLVNPSPKAPSAVRLRLPQSQFGEPVALTEDEIELIISRFVHCAVVCQKAGFTGVQFHAAHGYLLSQFLSPLTNQRDDQWGGCLENRARALLSVVSKARVALGAEFPISVKLNSADFQKGGFDFEESLTVAQWLAEAGVDLLEISGGTYEQPRLLNLDGVEPIDEQTIARSTMAREAYFVDFAKAIREKVSIPIMVTGGLRRRDVMEHVLDSGGADMIGLGRPLCVETDGPSQLLNGADELGRYENNLSLLPSWLMWMTRFNAVRTINSFATQFWFYEQIANIGRSGTTDDSLTVFSATLAQQNSAKTWMKSRKAGSQR